MKNQHPKSPRGEKSPNGLGWFFRFIRLRKDRNWGKGDKTLWKWPVMGRLPVGMSAEQRAAIDFRSSAHRNAAR